MVDIVKRAVRSRMMAGIRAKNTKPEMLVRRMLFAEGFRFCLHRRDLPGKPDIVLPKYRTAIFVHGCFWHAHDRCRYFRIPSSNTAFWSRKINGNVSRDRVVRQDLLNSGWRVLIVWECATKTEKSRLALGPWLAAWLRGKKTAGEKPQRAWR